MRRFYRRFSQDVDRLESGDWRLDRSLDVAFGDVEVDVVNVAASRHGGIDALTVPVVTKLTSDNSKVYYNMFQHVGLGRGIVCSSYSKDLKVYF